MKIHGSGGSGGRSRVAVGSGQTSDKGEMCQNIPQVGWLEG